MGVCLPAATTGERYGDLNAVAWYSGNSGNLSHLVAQKQPNNWGLYDTLEMWMNGARIGGRRPITANRQRSIPRGLPPAAKRYSAAEILFLKPSGRAAFRIDAEPSHANKATGLRLAAISAGS